MARNDQNRKQPLDSLSFLLAIFFAVSTAIFSSTFVAVSNPCIIAPIHSFVRSSSRKREHRGGGETPPISTLSQFEDSQMDRSCGLRREASDYDAMAWRATRWIERMGCSGSHGVPFHSVVSCQLFPPRPLLCTFAPRPVLLQLVQSGFSGSGDGTGTHTERERERMCCSENT